MARRRQSGGGGGSSGGGPEMTLPEVFREMRSDYSAAKASRFRRRRSGLPSGGSGADFHIRSESDFLKVLEYARDMDRNDAVIGQMIDRAVLNTVQSGFGLDPQTGDKALDQELWAYWDEWAGSAATCDLAGVNTFADMERLVLRSVFLDGDIFVIPTDEGAMELVEAHRCRTPKGTRANIVNGIKLNRHRRRRSYYFTIDDVDPALALRSADQTREYPAWDEDNEPAIFHIVHPKRCTQTRGMSVLAPIFDMSGMVDDILFNKLVQQQICSLFGFIRKTPANARPGGFMPPLGSRSSETQADGTQRTVEELAPGMNVWAQPGEEIEAFSSNVPNPEFFDHIKLTLTFLGINIGLPLVMVLMDAKETNFSGWRGAINQAQMGFIGNQQMLKRRFHSPVYRWKLRQWAAEDKDIRKARERLGDRAFFAHQWNAPRWSSIQPKDDAEADELRISARQTSPRRLHAEHGQDYETVVEEIVSDNALAIRRAITEAKKIEQETQEKVAWKDLLVLQAEAPKGMGGGGAGAGEKKAAGAGSTKGKEEAAA